jgi:signal transduction histidine kinase
VSRVQPIDDVVSGPPEVRRLASAFDAMSMRLESLLASHRTVVADVAHQLRTPMSALRLRLELLAGRESPDATEVGGALDELGRLSRLVDGLLAVARAESTVQPAQPVEVDAIVRERVAAWAPLAAERDVDISVNSKPDAWAWAVPDHLEQVLDNLFANCFDLEPPPRHIWAAVAMRGHDIVVSLADDGPGMTPTQRALAFQRFVTGHADSGGSGLGLAIVHRLVIAGGGSVRLDEAHSGGLLVTVSLPRAPRSPAAAGTATQSETEAGSEPTSAPRAGRSS